MSKLQLYILPVFRAFLYFQIFCKSVKIRNPLITKVPKRFQLQNPRYIYTHHCITNFLEVFPITTKPRYTYKTKDHTKQLTV